MVAVWRSAWNRGSSDPETAALPQRTPPRPPVPIGSATPDDLRRYGVYRGSWQLGTTDLEVIVEPGARAAGVFHPTALFSAVSSVFLLYRRGILTDDARMLREYVRQRDQLDLRIWRAGERLDARVELISRWERHFVIHVSSRDERFWRWRFPDTG